MYDTPHALSSTFQKKVDNPHLLSYIGHMNATEIIAKFGGVRPMGAKINVAPTTIQHWKNTGNIPMEYHAEIVRLAQEARIDLIMADMEGAARARKLGVHQE